MALKGWLYRKIQEKKRDWAEQKAEKFKRDEVFKKTLKEQRIKQGRKYAAISASRKAKQEAKERMKKKLKGGPFGGGIINLIGTTGEAAKKASNYYEDTLPGLAWGRKPKSRKKKKSSKKSEPLTKTMFG